MSPPKARNLGMSRAVWSLLKLGQEPSKASKRKCVAPGGPKSWDVSSGFATFEEAGNRPREIGPRLFGGCSGIFRQAWPLDRLACAVLLLITTPKHQPIQDLTRPWPKGPANSLTKLCLKGSYSILKGRWLASADLPEAGPVLAGARRRKT